MRHVDEGTVHAWLDRQVSDPQEIAWITTHLRECATCSARVAEEEATIREAEALLGSVAPWADGSREAFDALVAGAMDADVGAGNAAPGDAVPGDRVTNGRTGYRRWAVPVGWAAALALAAGLGWSARYLTSSRSTTEHTAVTAAPEQMARTDATEPVLSLPGPAIEAPPAERSDRREREAAVLERARERVPPSSDAASDRAPVERTRERVRSGTPAGLTDTADGARQAGAGQSVAAQSVAGPGVAGQSAGQPAGPDSGQVNPAAPLVELPTQRSVSELLTLVPGQAAAPPPLALPFGPPPTGNSFQPAPPVVDVANARQEQVQAPEQGQASQAPQTTVTAEELVALPTSPEPAPERAAAAPGGVAVASGFVGRGVGPGAGGGAGGGRGGGGGGGRGGLRTASETADGIDWMVLPREAATARSGMALYGIEGLTPSRTMINADASRVRTVYMVNAAEVVLLQEKQPPPEATANQGRVTFNGAPAVSTEKPADLALRRAQSPTVWSSVRGEVIITVRGADAAALGARVRLD